MPDKDIEILGIDKQKVDIGFAKRSWLEGSSLGNGVTPIEILVKQATIRSWVIDKSLHPHIDKTTWRC